MRISRLIDKISPKGADAPRMSDERLAPTAIFWFCSFQLIFAAQGKNKEEYFVRKAMTDEMSQSLLVTYLILETAYSIILRP